MNREPDPEGPEHPDRLPDEFDAIVAGWLSEGDVPRWPDDAGPDDFDSEVERLTAPLFDAQLLDATTSAPPPPAAIPPHVEEEDEHFVPPEPPPLPRIGPPALVGITLIALGLILIISPGWVGVPSTYGLPLGLVSIASGLGWLVLRLWPDHRADEPDDYDDDDGAIL